MTYFSTTNRKGRCSGQCFDIQECLLPCDGLYQCPNLCSSFTGSISVKRLYVLLSFTLLLPAICKSAVCQSQAETLRTLSAIIIFLSAQTDHSKSTENCIHNMKINKPLKFEFSAIIIVREKVGITNKTDIKNSLYVYIPMATVENKVPFCVPVCCQFMGVQQNTKAT